MRPSPIVIASVLSLSALLLGAPGCSKSEPAVSVAPVETYASRGRIVALPDPKGALFQVHHEEIPGFKAKDGRVVGMKQMIMPFALNPSASLGDLKAGDAVEFTFTVDWARTPPQEITIVARLPEGATLNISSERE